MNARGPGAAPVAGGLRALRHPPALVDDAAAAAFLASVSPTAVRIAGDASGTDTGDADAELVRWTRAWLLVWQGALHAAGVIGTVEPWTVPLRLADLPTLKGDPDRRRRAAAERLLARAGLLVVSGDGRDGRLVERAFTAHRAGLELDWPAVVERCRLEPAALLAVRALAEVPGVLEEPTPVSLRELAARSGYAEKQVRTALRRLGESGLVEVTEIRGQATRYQLSGLALGHVADPSPVPTLAPLPIPGQGVTSRGVVARPEGSPPGTVRATAGGGPTVQAPVPAAGGTVALRLTFNGVTLSVAPGLSVHVGYDADGVPHLTIPRGPNAR